jgi:hypothetical protein
MSKDLSPFNWKQDKRPSIFMQDHAFNGMNTRVSERASETVKQTVFLRGSNVFLAESPKQAGAHSKAQVRTK